MILDEYLNDIYYGHGLYGIETASQSYFGKHAAHLTLAQAAMLAGVIAAPGRFDPILHPEASRGRRNQVLQRMTAIGWISAERATRAE